MKLPHLQPDERVLAEVRLSWLLILDSFGIFLATLLTLGLAAWLRRRSTVLVITNRRLVWTRGVFDRNVVEMELSRVAQVEMTSGILDRMAGVGRLKIIALDQFNFEMYPVAEAERIKDLIMSSTSEARRSVVAVPGVAGATVAPASSKDEILGAVEKLGKMRDGGLLSDSEFQAKKSELLRRL